MDYLHSLRILAMQAVLKEPAEYSIRRIHRWYSREFHTPLHIVEKLPTYDIFRHFFESNYEDMDEEARETEIKTLLQSPEEEFQEALAKDAEDAESWEFAAFSAEQARLAQEAQKQSFADAASRIQKENSEMGKAISEFKAQENNDGLSSMNLKDIKELPPDIQMSFIEETDFEGMLDGDFANPDGDK